MRISKIKIIPNYRKPWAKRLAKTVSVYLKKHGFEITHHNADATICIGGDGTIFYANHLSRISGAILGIGSKTSVVCQLRNDNWKNRLLRMLKNAKTEKRISLDVRSNTKNKSINAVNDVVIHANDYRIIRIFLECTLHIYMV